MNCFECDRRGLTRPATGFCRFCNAALCSQHLREAAQDSARGATRQTCSHNTWRPEATARTPSY